MDKTPTEPRNFTMYDYANQAFVRNQRYVRCGHQGACQCYGTAHEGEHVPTHTLSDGNCTGCMVHGVHVAADCHPFNDRCRAEHANDERRLPPLQQHIDAGRGW